jgi:hypothetical protein
MKVENVKHARVAESFQEVYGTKYPTVGQFYAAHKDEVVFVDLVNLIPDFKVFIGLADTIEEAA